MERFGTIIRRKRQERGWTIAEAARKLRTAATYLNGMETSRLDPPSTPFVARVAKVYALDTRDLQLRAWVEKAPQEVRAELKRRLFAWQRGAARGSGAASARKQRRKAEELLDQAARLLAGILDLAWPARLDRAPRRGPER